MNTEIRIPKLGASMEEGQLSEWLKKDREFIEKGAPLYLLETDKLTQEIESPAAGKLNIIEPAGKMLPVGALIALIA